MVDDQVDVVPAQRIVARLVIGCLFQVRPEIGHVVDHVLAYQVQVQQRLFLAAVFAPHSLEILVDNRGRDSLIERHHLAARPVFELGDRFQGFLQVPLDPPPCGIQVLALLFSQRLVRLHPHRLAVHQWRHDQSVGCADDREIGLRGLLMERLQGAVAVGFEPLRDLAPCVAVFLSLKRSRDLALQCTDQLGHVVAELSPHPGR